MSLSNYDYEKLLDDIKLISRAIKVVSRETNDSNRQEAASLACDIVDRLYRDVKELRDGFKPISHTGHVECGENGIVKITGDRDKGYLSEGEENA